MKILTVLGARPQFIKAAVVSQALSDYPSIEERILHTGQHYDSNMSDIFFSEMQIPRPHYNLQSSGTTHAQMTGRMMEGIEAIMMQWEPDVVLVYGDTNSTLAGALAAAKLHIDIAHVEAGLRSFNRIMPEEINRILTDHISQFLYAPTEGAVLQLATEGITRGVECVGDVMYDASLHYSRIAEIQKASSKLSLIPSSPYILATIHRAENTDNQEKLSVIMTALSTAAQTYCVVCPIHPRTRKVLSSIGYNFNDSKIRFIDPIGYLDMALLEANSSLIVTDSGGVQKEAYFHRVPCVILRDQTEWTELVDSGWNSLCGTYDVDLVVSEILAAIGRKGRDISPYGKGDASEKIAHSLAQK